MPICKARRGDIYGVGSGARQAARGKRSASPKDMLEQKQCWEANHVPGVSEQLQVKSLRLDLLLTIRRYYLQAISSGISVAPLPLGLLYHVLLATASDIRRS